MKKLNLTNSYNLYSRDLENYGGAFSFFEKLKLKGIGSAKLVYEKGIDEIDKIILESGNKVAILNFELLKNGLLLRYNINNEIGCFAFRLDEICSINFLSIPIQIRVKRFGRYITKIVYRGELELINNNEKVTLAYTPLKENNLSTFEKSEQCQLLGVSLQESQRCYPR
jgi:hypothetical protein